MTVTLFPDQLEAIEKTRLEYRRNKAVVLQASCGFGKSYCAAEIARSALKKGQHVTLTVPRLALIDQLEQSMSDMGVRGVDIQMVQTAIRKPIPGSFLIADEAHYHYSAAWQARLKEFLLGGGKILGLTASPIAGMDSVYGAMVQSKSVRWLMDHGRLSKFRAFGPSNPDLSKLPIYNGEYAKGETADLMSKPSITGSAVETWKKIMPGMRTIGYAVSREHSKRVVQAFMAAGIPAEHIDGDTPKEERRNIALRFARKETLYLSNVALFQLGYDLASQVGHDVTIEAMSDLAPCRSLQMQTQKWGRVIRKKDQAAIISDHANNIRSLGVLPDSDIEWSIASGARRRAGEAALAVSICHACYAAFRTARECPYCMAERKLTPREIEEREGELAEIIEIARKRDERIERGRAVSGGLKSAAQFAKSKGYKVGWLVKRMELKGEPVTYQQALEAMK